MRPLVGGCLAVTLVFWMGCATREWVQEVVAEREARIDQQVSTATAAVAASAEVREQRAREREDAIGVRLTAMEQALAEARERSRVALSRADEAAARAAATDARLTRLWANRHARRAVNSLTISFGFDEASLDDQGKSMLLALVHELRGDPTLTVDLEGYADSRGSRDYNVQLSRRRVEAVQRYLEEQGVERRRINGVARGPMNDPGLSDERKRRVVVRIMLDVE